ncbi:tyrosine-type recombinase/integrase [Conexibacter sp. W3-3-2]|uniref:tyrosine-type recombinase/integrase n=1 Tax=Conexibacter sp. W3-3-2 TaxID=2675227 RepID=UPI0012B73461|nr:tyrosine-type recombinase/integrase [Conexibacter sp. W3-3-2]MTD43423.1 tyrosine-type recombinase/integrase [Conexibacter sp. W3-3-2]
MSRRSYGSGSLTIRKNRRSGEVWVGQWRDDGRLIKRTIGPKRRPGTADGLGRAEAEARLRELMATVRAEDVRSPAQRRARPGEMTIADLWAAYRDDRGRELKPTTLHDYGACVHGWFVPHFGEQPIHRITRADVDRLVDAMAAGRQKKRGDRTGLAPKSIRNYVTLLSTLFNYAIRKRRWLTENPAADITVPADDQQDADELEFLEPHEVRDLAAAAARDAVYGRVDRALILTSAMTGLRQGEALALRWESVDIAGGRLRVVRSVVRGRETTPKSKERRSVPLAPDVARVLIELGGVDPDPEDLVFPHPLTGGTLTRTPSCAGTASRSSRSASTPSSAGTACATRSARGWRRPALTSGRSRRGSATRA